MNIKYNIGSFDYYIVSRLLSALVVLIALVFFSGCAVVKNIKEDNISLQQNEGLLLTKIHTSLDYFTLYIETADSIPEFVKRMLIQGTIIRVKNEELVLIKLKSGESYISTIRIPGNMEADFSSDYAFNIESQKINYVGDLTFTTNGYASRLNSSDNSTSTFEEARKKYPKLFSEYGFAKNIPVFHD